jgi:uncharacterized Ntn-hydrolase superfamily protein
MTYSIVARDPGSGRFGIAIQTCWPFVGAGCPWVESGVGAVVTQSFTEIAHGPNGLARLRSGDPAAAVLQGLLAADPGEAIRQVGVVDRAGRAAAHTGSRCVDAAGHITAEGVAIQANMMERPSVWPAMLAAWVAGTGPSFADRLLAVLRAAEAEGGDIRGRQSAALVVSGTPEDPPWKRHIDIRVDDHPAPLEELARLLRLHQAFEALDQAEELGQAGDRGRAEAASTEAGRLAPDDGQVMVWRAIGLAGADRVEEGRRLLATATTGNPRWPEFLARFASSGAQPELVEPTRRLLAPDV